MKVPLLLALTLASLLSGCTSGYDAGGSGLFALAAIERGSADPVRVGDCDDVEELLEERALVEARVALEQSVENGGYGGYGGYGHGGVVMMEDTAATGMATTASSAASPSAGGSSSGSRITSTGTNNQERDADEGDIVKTDGAWTYILSGGTLRILRAQQVGDVSLVGALDLDGSGHGGMLLLSKRGAGDADDRLVAFLGGAQLETLSSASSTPTYGLTHIVVISLADRSAPAIVAERWIEGESASAHLMGGVAYAVIHKPAAPLPLVTHSQPSAELLAEHGLEANEFWAMPMDERRAIHAEAALEADAANRRLMDDVDLADQLPRQAEARYGRTVPVALPACTHIVTVPEATGRGISTIVALDIDDAAVASNTLQVVGARPIVYASESTLVLASASQDDWWYWEQPALATTTDLQTFALDGLTIEPQAAGAVPGLVMDTFGLDIHGGKLRVVSATGTFNRGWLPETSLVTTLTVLEPLAGQLVPTGSITGLAPGERLWSVRFTDARAYVVTFKAMDPLWVIDLESPVPRVLGELHVAGVSTYIHPMGDDERLLTVGYGGGDDGLGLDESTVVVALFDVSNPARPRQLDHVDLSPGDGYAYTTALHEHKAFTYWADIGVLALPLSSGSYADGNYRHHTGLSLVDVSSSRLELRGQVDQDALASRYGSDVERSWFSADTRGRTSVYALSPAGVTSHDLTTLEAQDSLAFQS